MSLARRTARQHETAASLRATAGVRSEDYWDFKPGQPVMTREGFPGVVTAVQDGPVAGYEQYLVTLDHGLGGGEYGPGELRPIAATTASTEHTAADDYPELGTVLVDRPDIAHNTVLASKTAAEKPPVIVPDHVEPVGDTCVGCWGAGQQDNGTPCRHCYGTGKVGSKDAASTMERKRQRSRDAYDDRHPAKTGPCDTCQGTGQRPGRQAGELPECGSCLGSGIQRVAEVTHEPVVDTDRLLPKACSHCGADGSLAFEASYEDTGRGFRATCSNCRGQMVTSGYGMWSPALPSEQNQPSAAPSRQMLGSIDSLISLANSDAEFGFHFTASWSDVRNKATTIRSDGGVHIVAVNNGTIAGTVRGEHHVYETQIVNVPGKRSVATWACACKWGAYAWGRSPAYKRFEGRMCSHALALHFEAQARGMFGRDVQEDTQRPSWMRQRTPIVTHHDRDTGENSTRRAVPPGNMKRTFSSLDVEGVYEDDSLDLAHPPVVAMFEDLVEADTDPADVMRAAAALGYGHDDSKALLFMGIEAAKKKHKKKRHHRAPKRYTHHECNGGGCRGCGGYGWGVGGWWGPWGGGVGNPQNAAGQDGSGGGDSGGSVGGGDGGGGAEASLQSQAAAWDPLDEFKGPYSRLPSGNQENPGSTGWATGADPWPHFDLPIKVEPTAAYGSLQSEAVNPTDKAKKGEGERGSEHHVDWHHCGQAKESSLQVEALDESLFEPSPGFEVESVLDDEPEPALPQTEADEPDDRHLMDDTYRYHDDHPTPVLPWSQEREPDEMFPHLSSAQSAEEVVAAFQATAKHLEGGAPSSDIAEAAKAALAKMALKEFSAAEQQALINEGTDVRAANLDRLDVTGTHYEAVLAATAAEEAADEEWLA